MINSFVRAGLPLLLVVFLGCGGNELPDTAPVGGTVTLDGEPVEDATVSFIPQGNRPASGTTDSSGRFELTTFQPGDGAVVGEHAVTVVKSVPKDPEAAETDPYAEHVNQLPAKYADRQTTPLRVEVPPGGNRNVELQLTSD